MKWFYLRDKNNNKVGCVASEKKLDAIYFAVSAHNPKDQYNPEAAREVATGRLKAGKIAGTVTQETGIKEQIMAQIKVDKKLPSRARNAARLWIRKCEKLKNETAQKTA